MRRLRTVLGLLAFVACFIGVALPVGWAIYAAGLPPLDTREQVAAELGRMIGSGRDVDMRQAVPGSQQKRTIELNKWAPSARVEILAPEALSPAVVRAQISWDGCPDYSAVPKEGGLPWATRLVTYAFQGRFGPPGAGRCELAYLDGIANTLGVPGGITRAIAAQRVHEALTHEEHLSFYLSAVYYAPATFGAADASTRLFGRAPKDLDVARAVELRMAQDRFRDVWSCTNPTKLRALRDKTLQAMEAFNLLEPAARKAAERQRLSCELLEGARTR